MFPGVMLEPRDLYLLEPFQIGYLEGWVIEADLAELLRGYPWIGTFMEVRYPPVAGFLRRVLDENGPGEGSIDRLLWTIADMLVYGKCPEVYDSLEFHGWDFSEVTSIVSLEGLRVIDAGAGTGRVAFQAAEEAAEVWAVEPVGRLRDFMRERMIENNIRNVHVVDGFLHRLPFPDDFADLLITSHALGWNLEEELPEMERVVRMGGHVIHCPGTPLSGGDSREHLSLVSCEWGYRHSVYHESDGDKRKYWKEVRGSVCVPEEGGI